MVRIASLAISLVTIISAAIPALASEDRSDLNARMVYNAMIFYPTKDTVWKVGDEVNVTWQTVHMPYGMSQRLGGVFLEYQENGTLHADQDYRLAVNVRLGDGNATFTVPQVEERDDYVIVMNASGKKSHPFTIRSA